jgi:hypothetical protein
MTKTLKDIKGTTVKELVSLVSEHTLNTICGKPNTVLRLSIAYSTLISSYFERRYELCIPRGIIMSSDELNFNNIRNDFLSTSFVFCFFNLFYFILIYFNILSETAMGTSMQGLGAFQEKYREAVHQMGLLLVHR